MPATLPSITPGTISPRYLRGLVGPSASVILEVGANDGAHTRELLAQFPHATIYAFEPDPRAYAKFKACISDPRVRVFNAAIGAADGEAEFHVSSGLPPDMAPETAAHYAQGWDQSGSLRAPKTHKAVWPWCRFEEKISVRVHRLDTFARENGIGRVDLVWADTQGAEGDLIAGGTQTLATTRFFYTEYSDEEWYEGQPTLQQLADMLPKFKIVHRFPMDVLFKNIAI